MTETSTEGIHQVDDPGLSGSDDDARPALEVFKELDEEKAVECAVMKSI